MLALRIQKGGHELREVSSLQKLKMTPDQRIAWGPPCYNNVELNSANNLNELEKRSICRIPRKEHLDFGLMKPGSATLCLDF